MPLLILGKGKLSREDSGDVGGRVVLNQGETETAGGEPTGVVPAPVRGFWEALLLCQGIELLQTISHISMEELPRIPILLTSAIPGHCYCRPSSRKRFLYAHAVTIGMGQKLEEMYQ